MALKNYANNSESDGYRLPPRSTMFSEVLNLKPTNRTPRDSVETRVAHIPEPLSVTLEVECLDRLYLNGYIRKLATLGGLLTFGVAGTVCEFFALRSLRCEVSSESH
jgi:hypothetical protein